MVIEHFTPEAERRGISVRQATKATPARWAMIVGLMGAFFATLPAYAGGAWWALVATPVLAWVVIANYWHDGLHFSLSCDWRVNATLPYLFPWLSSPWLWYGHASSSAAVVLFRCLLHRPPSATTHGATQRAYPVCVRNNTRRPSLARYHQHVIGHHCYTNVAHKDPDLAHAPQLMREHESIKWRPTHATQESWSRVLLVWSVAVGAGLQVRRCRRPAGWTDGRR